ncbi:MAG: Uncharacterised protein [Methanobacteriota archaeon]|nr:hypothetical protein [Euryarchaeota archaeon]CAI8176370.1 MAG: Uncharacterised protein [Euryarchaeota archaeon]
MAASISLLWVEGGSSTTDVDEIGFGFSMVEGGGFDAGEGEEAPNKPEPPMDGRALPLVVREGVRGVPSSSDIIP